MAVSQFDKQNNADIILPVLSNHKGFLNALKGFDLAVDFSCADADPARVQGGIRSPMNDGAPGLRQRCPITMPPNIRKMIKIGGLIGATRWIVPEFDWH